MNSCNGETIAAFATAAAIQISQNQTADDLALLGALLTAIGDQLSLLSIAKQNCAQGRKK
jgi:hypothetical protein